LLLVAVAFVPWYITCLPQPLFSKSTSTVLLDKNGQLLGAKIAEDGQWRFRAGDSVPRRFELCLLEFEDRGFNQHFGISLRGLGRATVQNIKSRRVVSGGSTLTMQLARLMRNNPPRTVPEKITEMVLATRLELRYSKKQILALYAANAPFGNNVVGLEAASWRYFGRGPEQLGWAECATLAVLPNAPGLIYPGKNRQRLLEKRNRLLKRLLDVNVFDRTTYELALQEPLPGRPLPLPQFAPHLLARFVKNGETGKTIKSSIDVSLQNKTQQLLTQHLLYLRDNKIYNGAVVISSVKSGKVLAYVGNIRNTEDGHSDDVDCAAAPRSTGSILKPFLYQQCLEDGVITPQMLLFDVPTRYGNFAPKNFSQQYDGAVSASQALARSLNVPMVRMLDEYGLAKFHSGLRGLGLSTIRRPAAHYGLSLILGGAEARLDELNAAYLQLAQQLGPGAQRKWSLLEDPEKHRRKKQRRKEKTPLGYADRASIYSTFEAMVDVNRPDEEGNWRVFSSSQKIAWKTGTSFGFRDAWAIGLTPDYVVAVWIGNADGEGRPGLTGVKAAAPLLFDIFARLPKSPAWFPQPKSDFCKAAICRESGHRAGPNCNVADTLLLPKGCMASASCPYHQVVHLSKDGRYRVDSDCESVFNMQHVKWFVLPPLVEKYYKYNHPGYRRLPDYKPECLARASDRSFALLYPRPGSRIYVPVEIDGEVGRTVFEATHRNSHARLYWHLDNDFIGETSELHQLALNPTPGRHQLQVVDENGMSVSVTFEAVASETKVE